MENIVAFFKGFMQFLELIGGLCMFLYGMRVMSEGIQKRAGSKLKRTMDVMTHNRFAALFTGLFVTSIIQSSSATTVLLVSFVNAGLISLNNAIGVVMGANIGTTLTAWIVSTFGFKFKIVHYALPAIAFALPLIFSKSERKRDIGGILVGFGLLFIGLGFMKDSVPDIDKNLEILKFVKHISSFGFFSVVLFVGLGTILTILVQSSSAAMAITLTMATKGWIDFPTAAAVVMGENIGTTITAYLASMGLGVDAKRTARAHMLFNVLGVAWMLVAFFPFCKMIERMIPAENEPVAMAQVEAQTSADQPAEIVMPSASGDEAGAVGLTVVETARETELRKLVKWRLSLFHTVFNVANSLLLIWFVPVIARVVRSWVREKPGGVTPAYAISGVAANLPDALESNLVIARAEIGKMALSVHDMLQMTIDASSSSVGELPAKLASLKRIEEKTDTMQREISNFLTECMMSDLGTKQARSVSANERIVDELESIADSAYSVSLLIDRKVRKGLEFHEQGREELKEFTSMVLEFIKYNSDFLSGNMVDKVYDYDRAVAMEDGIDEVRNRLRKRTSKALGAGGDVRAELIFIDIVRHLEHIGDYCMNISEGIRDLV